MFACLHAPGNLPLAVECARGFSPHIEEFPPDTVIFDVRGLESLYGPPRQLAREIERRAGVPASIAIAANPDAAMHAALGIRGVTVIAPGKEAEVLAPLPVNLLRASPETAELLHLWGIRTFGEFAALPPLGVAARLGEEGTHLQRLARGEGYRQLQPLVDPLEFEDEMELEHPVELIEPLSFILARLLNDVCGRLGARSLATNEIRVRLTLENAPEHSALLRLPVPMLDPKAFLKMLQLELSGSAAGCAGPESAFEGRTGEAAAYAAWIVHALLARAGEAGIDGGPIAPSGGRRAGGNAGTGGYASSRYVLPCVRLRRQRQLPRKQPVAEAPRLCLRRFRPPRYAQVIVVNHQPVRVASPSVNGRVVMAKGPWRTSGEWWRADAWNRDEWDIALESGALYRVFHEIDGGRWFLEGSYD